MFDSFIGRVSLFSNDLKERNDLTPWLGSLYVSTDYRNRGIAKQLMDKVIKTSRILGYEILYLRTEHARIFQVCFVLIIVILCVVKILNKKSGRKYLFSFLKNQF